MVRVERFEHHRVANMTGSAYCRARIVDHSLCRHGQSKIAQQVVRIFLVTGNFDRDMSCLAGNGGLYALLIGTMAKLHQRVFIQSEKRDSSFFSSLDQRRGTGAQLLALCKHDELVTVLFIIKIFVNFRGNLLLEVVR